MAPKKVAPPIKKPRPRPRPKPTLTGHINLLLGHIKAVEDDYAIITGDLANLSDCSDKMKKIIRG